MNTMRRFFAVAALASVMPSAFAASTVDLTVTGTIVPASCTPTIGSSNVHFGKISSADLDQDAPTNMFTSAIRQSLTVNCSAATIYGIRGIDNRAATVGDRGYNAPYGLGVTDDGEKLGAHYVEIQTATSTIDGKPAFVMIGDSAGATWSVSGEGNKGIRNTEGMLGFTDQAGETTGPIPIKEAVYGLQHFLVIAPASGLTLTNEVALDGSATIEVVYL